MQTGRSFEPKEANMQAAIHIYYQRGFDSYLHTGLFTPGPRSAPFATGVSPKACSLIPPWTLLPNGGQQRSVLTTMDSNGIQMEFKWN